MRHKRARPEHESRNDLRIRDSYFEAISSPRTTRDFLEELRRRVHEEHPDLEAISTYRLAIELHCKWSTVKRWLKGEGTFSHSLAYKIAEKLNYPPEYVVACVEHERTDDQLLKAMWTRIAGASLAVGRRVAAFVAITWIAALGLFPASRPVQAQPVIPESMEIVNPTSYSLYELRRLRRRRLADRLLGWLLWTPRPTTAWGRV